MKKTLCLLQVLLISWSFIFAPALAEGSTKSTSDFDLASLSQYSDSVDMSYDELEDSFIASAPRYPTKISEIEGEISFFFKIDKGIPYFIMMYEIYINKEYRKNEIKEIHFLSDTRIYTIEKQHVSQRSNGNPVKTTMIQTYIFYLVKEDAYSMLQDLISSSTIDIVVTYNNSSNREEASLANYTILINAMKTHLAMVDAIGGKEILANVDYSYAIKTRERNTDVSQFNTSPTATDAPTKAPHAATNEERMAAKAITAIRNSLGNPDSLKVYEIRYQASAVTDGEIVILIDYSANNQFGAVERYFRAYSFIGPSGDAYREQAYEFVDFSLYKYTTQSISVENALALVQ